MVEVCRSARAALVFAVFLLSPLSAQAQIDVGQGAPEENIRTRFTAAYFRNRFNALVSLPPLNEVQRLGTAGLQQLFQDAAKTANVRLALVKANANVPPSFNPTTNLWDNDVYQITATMYAYWNTVGVNTAGFPTADTGSCPVLDDNPCAWQTFDKNYALFVYPKSLGFFTGTTLSLRDPYFTAWKNAGGVQAMGGATTPETAVTSPVTASAATLQTFRSGALFNITSGLQSGQILLVKEPFFSFFVANGGVSQFLGFPTGNETLTADGRRRQAFEGGLMETAVDGAVALRLPVRNIAVTGAGAPIRLKIGDTFEVEAQLSGPNGETLTGRTIAWQTSNGRVATVVPNGARATVKAVGGGTALVTAVSEGRSSPPLNIIVSAPCCSAGEGAPTAAIEQAFLDIITRNRLAVRLPTAGLVRRLGAGYLQEFLTTAAAPQRVLLTVADGRSVGYYLTGGILTRWESAGGAAGPLGYPNSDPSASGRQTFDGRAALAGTPVRLVTGPIYEKWAAQNFEAGPAGLPASEPAAFLTFQATAGQAQAFERGSFYLAQSGALSGRTSLVRGAIYQQYLALGGPAGAFGLALGDELVIDGRRRQEFEGGTIEADLADTAATATERERKPSFTATPNPVTAGGSVRLALGGFPAGATLRVSAGTQPDFLVETAGGAHVWQVVIPREAASATVRVRAVTSDGRISTEGTYSIRSLAETRFTLTKTRGDTQVGPAGARLPLPLRVLVRDTAGNPVAGQTVTFEASPGASVEPFTARTGSDGQAETRLRLPAAEGIARVTARVPGQVVTFDARGEARNLPAFPKLSTDVAGVLDKGPATIREKGGMLAVAASILRYHQERGEFPIPNGPADVAGLNIWLRDLCSAPAEGTPVCDGYLTPQGTDERLVNLWRLPAFAGGAAAVVQERNDVESVRDVVASGSPALVALQMSAGGVPAGMLFVAATGVTATGAVSVHDPEGRFGRNTLNELLNPFSLNGRTWVGTMAGVVRFAAQAGGGGGFLLAGGSEYVLRSAGPECGSTLEWLDRTADAATGGAQAASPYRLRFCDGASPLHQLEAAGPEHSLEFTDFSPGGGKLLLSGQGAAGYKLERSGAQWVITAQAASLTGGDDVLNAASLAPDVAPGTLVAIFGSGLAGPGGSTTVEFDGVDAPVVAAGPFRVNAAIPDTLPPGIAVMTVRSPYGSTSRTVELRPVAPALFRGEGNQALAVNHDDGQLNSAERPVLRGRVLVVYATGLGAVAGTQVAETVEVRIGGRTAPVLFAGPAPGFPGVYQINVRVPADLAPGVAVGMSVTQMGHSATPAEVSIQ